MAGLGEDKLPRSLANNKDKTDTEGCTDVAKPTTKIQKYLMKLILKLAICELCC